MRQIDNRIFTAMNQGDLDALYFLGICYEKGKGVYLWDVSGKRYIDCTSQGWAMYLGHANDEIRQTVYEHMGNLGHLNQNSDSLPRYALAKKRFFGKTILFSLIVCAMALPKQVILIPLLREMSALGLYDTIWAVIFPIVGWPFGVFLLKQFAEGIPTEMVEACRIDGASEWRTFTDVMFPMIKPGVGACAIFTFINSWNDYFMQLIMLTANKNLTISLGIATMQGESSTDYGLLMAGAALASVPIIIVFLIFQKYFTKGITMGAVKG